ncbi:MAG: high-potential iron-sulfur protein [Steroidobacteraceae bacterium]
MRRPLQPAARARRALIKKLAIAAGAAATLPYRASSADEPRRLDVKDPAAVALGYVENAAQLDVKKYPSYVKGSSCENCLLLQGSSGSSYRPCTLFPGKVVSAGGWCSGWTPEI